jgi:hypothetical protein
MADDKEPKNKSRIVIETPLTVPEKRMMDRMGRINPYDKRWSGARMGRRKETRRA